MINRTELNIEERLVREVAALRREMEALKAKQLLGADSVVTKTSLYAVWSVSVPANAVTTWRIKFYSNIARYVSEPALSIYVDTYNDVDYLHNMGSALTTEQKKLMYGIRHDPAYPTDSPSGAPMKSYVLWCWNWSATEAKTLYFVMQLLYPALDLTEGSEEE